MAAVSTTTAELFSTEFMKNPYPTYARLREEAPAIYIEDLNAWLITRYDDVKFGLQRPELIIGFEDYQRNKMGPSVVDEPYYASSKYLLTFLDGSLHSKVKRVVIRSFTNDRIMKLLGVIESSIETIIDGFEKNGEVELVYGFTHKVPLTVICAIMGIPMADADRLQTWVHEWGKILEFTPFTPDQLERVNHATLGLVEYFDSLVEQRLDERGDDLVSNLLNANDEAEDKITREQLVSTLINLYFGGQDTQMHQTANMLAALESNPLVKQMVVDDPAVLGELLPELWRYDCVGQMLARTAATDVEIAGQLIRKGQNVMLCIASANRDPSVFVDPDTLWAERHKADGRPLPTVTFGAGAHMCAGRNLVQYSVPMMIKALYRRLPDFRIDLDKAVRNPSPQVRGYQTLPATWTV